MSPEGPRRGGILDRLTIAELLGTRHRDRPDAPALLAPDRRAATCADLWRQVDRVAATIREAGLDHRARIAVCVPNGPEAAAAALAVAASASCAPLNPAYQAGEFRFYLEDARADAVIVPEAERGPIRDVAAELGLAVLEMVVDPAAPAGCFELRPAGPTTRRAGSAEATEPASSPSPDDVALILHTSGTTARPKIVPLSQANLVASARSIAAHLSLSPDDRCLNVMPLFHIHGLVGALLATLAGGGSIVCTPGFDEHAFFDWVAEFAPSWYTAVPTIHQAIVANGAAYRSRAPSHRFRFARSSSAALPPTTLAALESLLEAPVVEAYGMTEASHQMATNPLPPRARKPGSVGLPAGVEIAILDDAGRELAQGETGEIAIRGPGVTVGYENNPEANAKAFTHGWFRTGDQGRLDADGYLVIAGRLKEIVNRGGEKVSPREVDEALLEHPEVAQAIAFAVPHASLGEDLAAAVVPKRGCTPDEAQLRSFLLSRLAGFKVPSRIVFVDAIPKGPTGKVQRTSLHEKLAPALATAFVAPRTEAERTIEAIFREVLKCGPLGAHANFFAAGGDSLLAIRLMSRLGASFKVELPLQALFETPTVAGLSERICALTGAARAGDADVGSRASRRGGALSATERRLLPIWERVLGVSQVGVDDSLLALQGDRGLLEPMLGEVRREFGVFAEGFPLNEFLAQPTIQTLARIIDAGVQPSSSLTVCLQPRGSKPPVFLVHAGGGYVFFYRALAARLGPDRPVYGVRAATRSDRGGPPFDRSASVESLAARYIEEIKAVQPQGPYTLGGACFGGVVAFEMARQLLACGERLAGPILLFDAFMGVPEEGGEYAGTGGQYALNRASVHLQRSSRFGPLGAAGYLALKVLKNLPTAVALLPPLVRKTVRRLKLSDAGIELTRWAGTRFGVPALLEQAQQRTMERFLDATARLLRGYRPGVLDGAIVLFKAAASPNPKTGWEGLASGGIVVHELPGAHLDMMEEPAVARTFALVVRCLDEKRVQDKRCRA